MEVDSGAGAGAEREKSVAEKALMSLKSFARIAWEDCRSPLTDASGSAALRWEIYSTWTLLLCIHHAEAEAERCWKSWKPCSWSTEAVALRQIFLQSRSLRTLGAVLRWLRWSHRWGPVPSGPGAAVSGSYERTRRAMQLHASMPVPLQQGSLALHPDGPLQHPSQFNDADLQDERLLLSQIFNRLRQGDLKAALKLCTDSGQAWRTAHLQGMLPFADGAEEVGYETMEDDSNEELLATLKAEHADWTELGVVESRAACNGNPWRRLWKEQCWDTAQRNLKGSSSMDAAELAIYGFCAGHYDALMATCGSSWMDRSWGELHCLKEWLVERFLELGGPLLGEGESADDDSPLGQNLRAEKLCGRLRGMPREDLEAFVAAEVQRLLKRVAVAITSSTVSSRFSQLHSLLIEAAWHPARGEEALAMLRSWLTEDVGAWGEPGREVPFLLKQFASYFAIWQRELLEESALQPSDEAEDAVDVIVSELVRALVESAAGPSWAEQCLRGHALDLIAEHAAALRPRGRIEAFSTLLLQLGFGAGFATSKALPLDKLRASDARRQTGIESPRGQALQRCLWVFWSRFPDEAFALLATTVRRILRVDEPAAQEEEQPDIGFVGLRAAVQVEDLDLGLLLLAAFWVVVREKAAAGEGLGTTAALEGLQKMLGHEVVDREAAPLSADGFGRLALELVVLPLFADTMLCISVKAPETAATGLREIEATALWRDAMSCGLDRSGALEELQWYLELCHRHEEWSRAKAEAKLQGGAAGAKVGSEASRERRRGVALDALLNWARPRLAADRPLLQPRPEAHTCLPEPHWEAMRRAIACKSILLLMSAFEAEGDFSGAFNDLTVAVAESPWLLSMLSAKHARLFLTRLAKVPSRSP